MILCLKENRISKQEKNTEQADQNIINNNTLTEEVDHNHQQTTTPTEQVEHTKHITAHTPDTSTTTTNLTTHNTPEVTDDDIRIRFTKVSNVMQCPLSTEEIACFKKVIPNPTEQQIVETCQLYIKARLQHIGALTPPTTTET